MELAGTVFTIILQQCQPCMGGCGIGLGKEEVQLSHIIIIKFHESSSYKTLTANVTVIGCYCASNTNVSLCIVAPISTGTVSMLAMSAYLYAASTEGDVKFPFILPLASEARLVLCRL